MLAVHFGAGNIGRGFIGALLSRAGYRVCFVDIDDTLVERIRTWQSYEVVSLEEQPETVEVGDVTALNSRTQPDRVVEAVSRADLVTTAVGPDVLKAITPLLSQGLKKRALEGTTPLNVIACENMIGASSALKEYVESHCDSGEQRHLREWIGFPDAAVDRIVPDQKAAVSLRVEVEPYFEWVVNRPAVKGELPPVQEILYTDQLDAFIERKLYTVNTGHAAAAYFGYALGMKTVLESMGNGWIRNKVEYVLEETGRLLTEKHGFETEEHRRYTRKMIRRFENPHITDRVTRVARTPIRKLGPEERLVGPARQLVSRGVQPVHLASAVAAALLYDWREDPETAAMQATIRKDGLSGALRSYSQLSSDHPLVELVLDQHAKLLEMVARLKG
ncbi:mannitol-1-phosphate 5-dehydrogenase [Paludifilum halophilum]|uniref:Mannitol-1-phosphate 5-dehydrogenase n=1 Tax=Paludifilum halophilum TaxID=1642702 RepID=A0A235BC51_9BACL|nr:mannitol-1-phosphate 5-dehydrogenase [Paludifilum halophilum]OYD09863.1 mannitol-1-phosphate 5-dehydrogenase [Paludifilum halophilum]